MFTNSAFSKSGACAVYSVSMRQYEPACSSVTQVLVSQVPVPPPDTTSPPTAAAASSSTAIDRSTRSALVSPGSRMRWPS